jgi:hypothetical protein
MRFRDPGIFLILDEGSGMGKIGVRDKHPASAWSKGYNQIPLFITLVCRAICGVDNLNAKTW